MLLFINRNVPNAMVKYSCYFINAADRFESVEPIDAVTNRDALVLAEQLLQRDRTMKAAEVWSQGELIGRVERESA